MTAETDVSAAATGLFVQQFYSERAKYPDTPMSAFRGAGRSTKANPNGEDELWWLRNGPQMVQRWEDWRNQSPWQIWVTPDGEPAIELEIVETYQDQTLKCIIDRVFTAESGGLIVLDLKSGSRTPVADLQLGFGATVLKLRYGVDVVGGTYWLAREGECTPIVPLKAWTPALTAHYARQLQTARANEIYLPNVSNLCRACGVRRYCLAVGGDQAHLDPDYEYVQQPFEFKANGGNVE